MQLIKDIIEQFVKGNITKADAEYQGSKILGGNWAIDYVDGSPIFVKYDYSIEEQELQTENE